MRPEDVRFDWLTVLPGWGTSDDGTETIEIAKSELIARSDTTERDCDFAFVSWASARLIRTGEWYEIAARQSCGAAATLRIVRRIDAGALPLPDSRAAIATPYPAAGDGRRSMQSQTHPSANFDWLLAWRTWSARDDRLQEAIFALDTFLQRSQSAHATWSLDFLSWKCERLARDGCWYEARLEPLQDRIDIRVLRDH